MLLGFYIGGTKCAVILGRKEKEEILNFLASQHELELKLESESESGKSRKRGREEVCN